MTTISMTDERQMLIDSARRFVERGYGAAVRDASIAHAEGCLPDTWQNFGEFGWLALPLPEAAGGLGGALADIALLAEELGRGAVNEPFVACAVLAHGLLAQFHADEAVAGWLPDLMDGSRRVALSSAAGLHASATAEGFALTGNSALLVGAAGADAYLVAAEAAASGEPAVQLFLVPADAPGLAIEVLSLYDGQRAVRLAFTQVAVSHALWRGTARQCQDLLRLPADRAALAHAAVAVGTMQRAFEITLDYLKTRKQFGRSIATNQVIQHRLVDLMVEIEEARALVHAAVHAVDTAHDAAATRRLVAAAQACIAQTVRQVWKESVQLHGAIGMTQEYELGQYVKRLAAVPAQQGSEQLHLEQLARLSLDTDA